MAAEVNAIKQGMGLDQSLNTQQGSITVAMNNISAAMNGLYVAIGEGKGNDIADGLNSIANTIKTITATVRGYNSGDMDAFYKSLSNLTGINVDGLKHITAVLNEIASWLNWLAGSGLRTHDALVGTSPRVGMSRDRSNDTFGDFRYGGLFAPPTQWAPLTDKPPGSSGGWFDNLFKGYSPINYAPPSQDNKPIHTTTAINMDGETVARIVQARLVDMHENSNSASTGNGMAAFDAPGYNPSFG
jgi:hypothetical protein